MGILKDISFQEESKEIKTKVKNYWTKRADSFAGARHEEFHSRQGDLWYEEICRSIDVREGLRVLDVGCGTGFFEAVLGSHGARVTGIDLTPDMIEEGKKLLARHDIAADLFVMDAENPDFPDETFDLVISRNLTWTLPDPVHAYQEWYRVLKKDGILLNFDAEYAKNFHSLDQTQNLAHRDLSDEMIEECHNIYHMLTMSTLPRPAWDEEILRQIGFREITTNLFVSTRIYRTKHEFYVPDPMFSIRAVK